MIKLTFWQKVKRWWTYPLYKNIALDMCEHHSKKLQGLTKETKEKIWNYIINDPEIDIIFRYEFEKDHKEHFIGGSYK